MSINEKYAPEQIGDFNNANQTNIYTVGHGNKAEIYTPRFAGGGLRYAQLTGLPKGVKPEISWLSGLKVYSNVISVSDLRLPVVNGRGSGTPDVLNKLHTMTRASQTSNLWSIPTDCPRRCLSIYLDPLLTAGCCAFLDINDWCGSMTAGSSLYFFSL